MQALILLGKTCTSGKSPFVSISENKLRVFLKSLDFEEAYVSEREDIIVSERADKGFCIRNALAIGVRGAWCCNKGYQKGNF